jgi:hypothetical protein
MFISVVVVLQFFYKIMSLEFCLTNNTSGSICTVTKKLWLYQNLFKVTSQRLVCRYCGEAAAKEPMELFTKNTGLC